MHRAEAVGYALSMHGARRGDPRVDRWHLPDGQGWCGATVLELAQRAAFPRLPEHERNGAPLLCGPAQTGGRFWGTGLGRAAWCRSDALVRPGDGFVFQRPSGLHVCLIVGFGPLDAVAASYGVAADDFLAAGYPRQGAAPNASAQRVWSALYTSPRFWAPHAPGLALGIVRGQPFVTWDGNGPGGVCGFNVRQPEHDNYPDGIVSWFGAFPGAIVPPPIVDGGDQTTRADLPPLDQARVTENPNGELMPRDIESRCC